MTTFSYLPELIETAKTKDVEDLSVFWMSSLATGLALWAYYGMLIGSIPLMALSAVSFVFVVVLLGMKFRYKQGQL